ncbi:glutathione transferase [Dendryphion nanum]|uniref:Glutathione transferase n=1 Tax=Dendryphion nanum TaxID=256645 RepID=A0A9P9CZN8_9PLEO|nr:glutathione transferase [Dendryphion nanum]
MSQKANQQDVKITLYWLKNSRAHRIIWLLEELELEYELKVFNRGSNMLAPAELKEIHPLGKAPVLTIEAPGVEKPIVLAESALIVEYLTEHFGRWLIPGRYPEGKDGAVGAETEAWLKYRFLMHYTEGSLMTILIVSLITKSIRKAPVPFFIKPITGSIANKVDESFVNRELKNHLSFLEDYFGEGEYFCGSDITGADIMMGFALEAAVNRAPLSETSYPKLYNFVRRSQDREAYKRAAARIEKDTGEKFVPMSEVTH